MFKRFFGKNERINYYCFVLLLCICRLFFKLFFMFIIKCICNILLFVFFLFCLIIYLLISLIKINVIEWVKKDV